MSETRDRHRMIALDKRVPASFKWYKGPTAPPVNGHTLIFWEDTNADVAKILMKRSDTTYVFIATEGTSGTYVLTTRQVIAGTLLTGGGALSGDVTLNVDEASIDHTAITNVGSNAHSVIDSHITAGAAHIADITTNPHDVTAAQVGGVLGYVQSATPSAPTGTDLGWFVDTDDNSISVGHSGTWYKVFG